MSRYDPVAYELYKAVLVHVNGWSREEAENVGGIDHCRDELFNEFVELLQINEV